MASSNFHSSLFHDHLPILTKSFACYKVFPIKRVKQFVVSWHAAQQLWQYQDSIIYGVISEQASLKSLKCAKKVQLALLREQDKPPHLHGVWTIHRLLEMGHVQHFLVLDKSNELHGRTSSIFQVAFPNLSYN